MSKLHSAHLLGLPFLVQPLRARFWNRIHLKMQLNFKQCERFSVWSNREAVSAPVQFERGTLHSPVIIPSQTSARAENPESTVKFRCSYLLEEARIVGGRFKSCAVASRRRKQSLTFEREINLSLATALLWWFGRLGSLASQERANAVDWAHQVCRASPATITLAAAAARIAIQASEDANLVPYAALGSAHDYCLTWSFGPSKPSLASGGRAKWAMRAREKTPLLCLKIPSAVNMLVQLNLRFVVLYSIVLACSVSVQLTILAERREALYISRGLHGREYFGVYE
ncbi:hypothetical protein B0H14DRAFT_3786669 [Mycena olivaceomarginata]|nr:hypothetical protein B0H14DRAFT_3786669 [Mycena olivaceomarginata]